MAPSGSGESNHQRASEGIWPAATVAECRHGIPRLMSGGINGQTREVVARCAMVTERDLVDAAPEGSRVPAFLQLRNRTANGHAKQPKPARRSARRPPLSDYELLIYRSGNARRDP